MLNNVLARNFSEKKHCSYHKFGKFPEHLLPTNLFKIKDFMILGKNTHAFFVDILVLGLSHLLK